MGILCSSAPFQQVLQAKTCPCPFNGAHQTRTGCTPFNGAVMVQHVQRSSHVGFLHGLTAGAGAERACELG